MNSIRNANLENKIVLLRSDLNSDVVNKKVLISERISESAKTINFLKKKKAKVVVIAHQGRLGESDFVSLRKHSKFLSRFTKIKFVPDILGKRAEKEVKKLKKGEAILLENIRGEKGELEFDKKNNPLEKLAEWCEIYVNDAFSVCHRNQFSITGFPKLMKSFAGLLLEKEVESLKKIKIKDCLYILGGAKPEDNMKLLGKNKILSCGLFGQVCTIAKGKNLGAQNEYLKKNIKNYDFIIKNLKKIINKNIETPFDFAVSVNGKRKEILLEDFPSEYEIFDIGEKTQKEYIEKIKNAKAIFMKGPAGYCADKRFLKGTAEILKAISRAKGFSLIGGGHLNDAIKKAGIPKNKFGHVSLSGGAFLSYIVGEKLPGLEALK